MRMEFGHFIVDIDTEKTRAFYATMPLQCDACPCDGCKNYDRASASLPQAVHAFFDRIGVDVRKPPDTYVNCTLPDGSLSYGGFYPVCGALVRGESPWVELAKGPDWSQHGWHSQKAYPLSEGFRIAFQRDLSIVPEGFPEPIIQLEIEACIPWVLDVENTY